MRVFFQLMVLPVFHISLLTLPDAGKQAHCCVCVCVCVCVWSLYKYLLRCSHKAFKRWTNNNRTFTISNIDFIHLRRVLLIYRDDPFSCEEDNDIDSVHYLYYYYQLMMSCYFQSQIWYRQNYIIVSMLYCLQ